MKSILTLILSGLLVLTSTASSQEAPAKKKKMAPMNTSSDVVTGKIYVVTPAKNRFTVRLDSPLVTATATNKMVAFLLEDGVKITIGGAEGKLDGLQKGMKVRVMPSAGDVSKASEIEATAADPAAKPEATVE
jgi:hypothetical protein